MKTGNLNKIGLISAEIKPKSYSLPNNHKKQNRKSEGCAFSYGQTGNNRFCMNISVIASVGLQVDGMDSKVARLVRIENQVDINKKSQAEFLVQYQKAVLLTLSEKGIIDEIQCQRCIDKLTEQFKNTIQKKLVEI